jgi:UPF0716 family protein affecting phage T7 exclusion
MATTSNMPTYGDAHNLNQHLNTITYTYTNVVVVVVVVVAVVIVVMPGFLTQLKQTSFVGIIKSI